MSRVNAAEACPSRSETTFGATPAANASVAPDRQESWQDCSFRLIHNHRTSWTLVRSRRGWRRKSLQLDGGELQAIVPAPAAELRNGRHICCARVLVTDRGGEEFEEMLAGLCHPRRRSSPALETPTKARRGEFRGQARSKTTCPRVAPSEETIADSD